VKRELASRAAAPHIDLVTVRETLAYIHDDVRQVPALSGLAGALSAALAEIEAVEDASAAPSAPAHNGLLPRLRLIPWGSSR
jgi:hypothetical protein